MNCLVVPDLSDEYKLDNFLGDILSSSVGSLDLEQEETLVRNLEIGNTIYPDFKDKVLNGEIVVPLWAIFQIENIPKNELSGYIWMMHGMKSDSPFKSLKFTCECLAEEIFQYVTRRNDIVGVIYILTNQSFPGYVKIGFTNDIDRRLKELNASECTPFSFEVYATLEVSEPLADKEVHNIIDTLSPNLRAKDINAANGKPRTKEFFAMSPETAFSILESIAIVNGRRERLKINVEWR